MELSLNQQDCLDKLKAFLSLCGLNLGGSNHLDLMTKNIEEKVLLVLAYAGSGKTEVLSI